MAGKIKPVYAKPPHNPLDEVQPPLTDEEWFKYRACMNCFHRIHDAGECRNCNCGEDELIRAAGNNRSFVPNYNYDNWLGRAWRR